jgi:uncharacterized protein
MCRDFTFPLFIFAYLIFVPHYSIAQHHPEAAGNWTGNIQLGDSELAIRIIFEYSDGEIDGSIDIPLQNAYNLPVEVTTADDLMISFQFETGTGPAVFRGEWITPFESVAGFFEQLGQRFPFHLKRTHKTNGLINKLPETELIIPTRAGQVSGSLVMTSETSPLVILLSGSGSQDRDETVAGFRVFGLLSSLLYEHGISSFRYDDRGIGQSRGNPDATLFELAEDAADIAGYLRSNFSDNISELILLGHSQGGLVASIAAEEIRPHGLIFAGSPFLRGDKIINLQINLISEEMNVPEAVVEQNLKFQERIYEVSRTGASWDDIEFDLKERMIQQLNQLPEQQRNSLGDMSSFIQSQVNRQLEAAKSRWFKSLIEFEPADSLSDITIPLLAIFGEKDMQVPLKENLEAAEELGNINGINLSTVVIPDANHLFQQANSGMPSEYGMLERSFADGFEQVIIDWILKISSPDTE